MKKTLITLLSLMIAATSFAAPRGGVRLALDETSLLPGTPTGMTVTIANDGDAELQIADSLWVVATDRSGHSFTLHATPASDGTAARIPADMQTIPAHGSRELRFDPIAFVSGSPFLVDERLTPGQYRLRAVLAPEVKPDGTFDASNAVVSKEELLTIATASEDDAAVWQWMQQKGGGQWGEREWSRYYAEFGAFVAASRPKSQYALFAGVFQRHNHGEVPPMLEEQVRRFPGKAFTDQAKLMLAQIHQQGMSTARLQANMQRAAEESDAAREIAKELTQSHSTNVRASATELLERIPTRAQLMR